MNILLIRRRSDNNHQKLTHTTTRPREQSLQPNNIGICQLNNEHINSLSYDSLYYDYVISYYCVDVGVWIQNVTLGRAP